MKEQGSVARGSMEVVVVFDWSLTLGKPCHSLEVVAAEVE